MVKKHEKTPKIETPEEELQRLEEKTALDKEKIISKAREANLNEEETSALENEVGFKIKEKSGEEAPDEVEAAEPETGNEESEAVVDSSTEKEAVNSARQKYIDKLNEYKKLASTKAKIKNFFKDYEARQTEKSEWASDKTKTLELKEAYDKARVELGNKMYADKKAELEKTITDPNELKRVLEEYKKTEILTAIHHSEQKALADRKADKFPSEKRSALEKTKSAIGGAVRLYAKAGEWKPLFKIKVGKDKDGNPVYYKYTAGKLARTVALGAAISLTPIGGAMGVSKIVRGFAGAVVGGSVAEKIKNVQAKSLAEFKAKKTSEEAVLKDRYSKGEIDLAQYEYGVKSIEKEITKKEKRQQFYRAVAGIGTGFGTSLLAGYVENKIEHSIDEIAGRARTGMPQDMGPGDGKIPTEPKPETLEPNKIPEWARIDEKHPENIGVTFAFRSQLEHNTELAHKLGYDVAKNKVQFLADLGKKLGYIGENGDVRVQANMGAAYVLQADASGNPFVTEYQNDVMVTDASGKPEIHRVGDEFENKGQQEKYEYYHEGTYGKEAIGFDINQKPAGVDGGFDIDQKPDFEGAEPASSGYNYNEATGEFDINQQPEGVGGTEDTTGYVKAEKPLGPQERPTMNDGKLSTNSATETMAQRGGASEQATQNIETTPEFIVKENNNLDKFFPKEHWYDKPGHSSSAWENIKNKSMDDMIISDGAGGIKINPDYPFTSDRQEKGVVNLLSKAKTYMIDPRGKSALMLEQEITKMEYRPSSR